VDYGVNEGTPTIKINSTRLNKFNLEKMSAFILIDITKECRVNYDREILYLI
jgi:hypothetical protein